MKLRLLALAPSSRQSPVADWQWQWRRFAAFCTAFKLGFAHPRHALRLFRTMQVTRLQIEGQTHSCQSRSQRAASRKLCRSERINPRDSSSVRLGTWALLTVTPSHSSFRGLHRDRRAMVIVAGPALGRVQRASSSSSPGSFVGPFRVGPPSPPTSG